MMMVHKSMPAQIVDAIKDENEQLIRELIKSNPEQISAFSPFGGQTWLGYASQLGKLGSVKALVGLGLDINVGDNRENILPICSAADGGHIQVVEYLLSKGSSLDVSKSVRNPLFAAIVGRSVEIVELLLAAGIDSKTRYNSETMIDMDAIAFALLRGEEDCAKAIAMWNSKGNQEIAKLLLAEADRIAEKNAY